MNISKYIVELLYEHDCVIIPGFGGLVCNYKPADIDPINHIISPPSKSVSFNKNLRTNDGLLLNYIATRERISFDEAFVSVYAWVSSSNGLLQRGEEVRIDKVGRFYNNVEGNLQFAPDTTLNFLKSSFGLKPVTATPILRAKAARVKEQEPETTPTRQITLPRNIWRIAATVLLIASLITITQLMRQGIEIKALRLDEAGMFNVVDRLFLPEPDFKPLPVEPAAPPVATEPAPTEEAVPNPAIENIAETVPPVATALPATYYVVIGAFAEEKNVATASARLQQTFPASAVLVEKGARLTRVAYSVGNDYQQALTQLKTAQQQDASYWLMKKE